MRVLHVINAGYEGGGAEKYVSQLVVAQRGIGYEVEILTSDLRDDLSHFGTWEFKHISSAGVGKYFAHLVNIDACRSLTRILRDYRPDIVHIHTISEASPAVLFLLKKTPTVMTVHGPEEYLLATLPWVLPPSSYEGGHYGGRITLIGKLHYMYHAQVQGALYRQGLKNVNLFIAPSNFIREFARHQLVRMVQLYNGIDLFSYTVPSACKTIMFVGALKAGKGAAYLVTAMQRVKETHPDAILRIVGDGEERQALSSLIRRLELDNNVEFLGWQTGERLRELYQSAAIVVIPSIWPENLPTVCIEAMSAGRVVIASKIGGLEEMIDNGVTGYVVEPAASEQIAEKILVLLDDRNQMEFMGQQASQRAEALFSLPSHLDSLHQIYRSQLEVAAARSCREPRRTRRQ